jgi:hypothetical protein
MIIGKRIWKEAVPSWHLPGGSEENHENYVKIADVLSEIRTEHLTDTILERYL